MYVPRAYSVSEAETVHRFIHDYPFATLISAGDAGPVATHLPLLVDGADDGALTVTGHMARANPQWRTFDGEKTVLAVFAGPHAYVSPAWYTTEPAVPTWNYTAVHVTGRPRLIEDKTRLEALVRDVVTRFEQDRPDPWTPDWSDDYLDRLIRHIAGFEFEVESVDAAFKLGQDKNAADRRGTVEALETQSDTVSAELARLMRDHTDL